MVLFAVALCVGGALGFVSHLPGRIVTYDGQQGEFASPMQDILGFLGGLFHENTMAVVVFGVAGSGHNGSGLTDTVMVAYFNPRNNRLSLISIPRDLWISDGVTHFKVNEALERNKLDALFARINEMTGIDPQGYVVVDLDIVKRAIDDLGGVDIVLKQPAVDWVSGYTMAVGPHHLTGDDAVWLIRNRYAPNGDFFREQNQQNIVKEALAKFKGLSINDKIALVSKYVLRDNMLAHAHIDASQIVPYVLHGNIGNVSIQLITFDFSTRLLKTDAIFTGAVGVLPPTHNTSVPATSSVSSTIDVATTTSSSVATATPSFISVLVPTAGVDHYADLRAYVQSQLAR
jgi:LCP family protein required for cell wall assembly